MSGIHAGYIGMGGTGIYTELPGFPWAVTAFYNDPTYGIVTYGDFSNNTYAQLYRIAEDDRKPTGLRVDLVGDPVNLFLPYWSDATVNRIDSPSGSPTALENHMLLSEVIYVGPTTPNRPNKVTGFAIVALTRSGNTLSLSSGHAPTTWASDGYFNAGNSQSIARVGPDQVARGSGICVGDGTVLGTGAFTARLDGISFSGGASTIESTTYFGSSTGPPNGPAVFTGLTLSGWFAKFEYYDESRGRLIGMRDNSGFFSTSRFIEGIEFTASGGSTGAAGTTVTTSNKTPWDSGPVPQTYFNTRIAGTGDGLTQTLQGDQPMLLYSEGASDVVEAVGTSGAVWSQFPFVSHSTLSDGNDGAEGYDGSMVVSPSWGNHLTFHAFNATFPATGFTSQYALTNQSGVSLSLATQAETAINSTNYPLWDSLNPVRGGARHNADICVVSFGATSSHYAGTRYYIEAFTT